MTITVDVAPMTGRGAITVTVTTTPDITAATLYHAWSGHNPTPVRGATDHDTSPGGFVVVDTEYPFGTPITYTATSTTPPDTSNAATITDPGDECRVNISDPVVPVLGAWFDVTERQELSTRARGDIVPIVGRRVPVAVTDVRSGFSGTTQVYCPDHTTVLALRKLTDPGRPVVFRYPPAWDEPIVYAAIGDIDEQRRNHHGPDHDRLVDIDWTEVAEPRGDIQQALGPTYQALVDYVPADGLADYQGVKDHNADYLELIVTGLVW